MEHVLMALWLMLYVAECVLIGWLYARSRNGGFIWLGVGLVVWPEVRQVLIHVAQRSWPDRMMQFIRYFAKRFNLTLGESGRLAP